MRYVIDTNILIGFSIYSPAKYYPTFWKWFEDQVTKGRIIILDVVRDECRNQTIKKWIMRKSIKSCIVKTGDEIKKEGLVIDSEYSLTTEEGGVQKSTADPVIIAYAKRHGYTVFSQERNRKPEETQNKIPDVCTELGVPVERWPENVLKELGFTPI